MKALSSVFFFCLAYGTLSASVFSVSSGSVSEKTLTQQEKASLATYPWEETYCNAAGSSWSYKEEVDIVNSTRTLTSTQCPNHFNVCQKRECAGRRRSLAIPQDLSVQLPLFPSFARVPLDCTCRTGPVAVMLNGVVLESLADDSITEVCYDPKQTVGSGIVVTGMLAIKRCPFKGPTDGVKSCGDSILSHSTQFDKCGGHVDSNGKYHYHTSPICLLNQLTAQQSTKMISTPDEGDTPPAFSIESKNYKPHSVQVGWVLDGFPLYGPFGPRGTTMLPCGSSGAHHEICLDECGGLQGELPSVDKYLYRYYIVGANATGECADYVENSGPCQRNDDKCCISAVPPTSARPYTIGCFKGCPLGEEQCFSTSKVTTTDWFQPSALATIPDNVYFGAQQAEAMIPESSSDEAPTNEANINVVASGEQSPSRGTVKSESSTIIRFPNNRSISIISDVIKDDGARGLQVLNLPLSSTDAYISGMTLESEGKKKIFFSTQRSIQILDVDSAVVKPFATVKLKVQIDGYNFGESRADIKSVSVQGNTCTSIVLSQGSISCTVIEFAGDNSLINRREGTDSTGGGLTDPIARAEAYVSAEDVILTTSIGQAHGPHPMASSVKLSGRTVIDKVSFEDVSFVPYAVEIFQGEASPVAWVYWSNLGHGDGSSSGGIDRAYKNSTMWEPVLTGAQEVLSIAVYRSSNTFGLDILPGEAEFIIYCDASRSLVAFVLAPIASKTNTIGVKFKTVKAGEMGEYVLLHGLHGVTSISIDQSLDILLITLKYGEIIKIDLAQSITDAIKSNGKPVPSYTSEIVPTWATRLGLLESQSRLTDIVALVQRPEQLKPWSNQRYLALDINLQRLVGLSETGFPLSQFDVGIVYGSDSLVLPSKLVGEWSATSDNSMDIYVAEYLGKIWRLTFKCISPGGELDFTSPPIRELLVDLSGFSASSVLRSLIAVDTSKGKNPSIFFEAST
jgi:hypothetical protein